MAFFTYDEINRSQFDPITQKQLDQLVQHFGRVEVNEVAESSEWCVRVVVDAKGHKVPLAALGSTVSSAAERLLRISVGD